MQGQESSLNIARCDPKTNKITNMQGNGHIVSHLGSHLGASGTGHLLTTMPFPIVSIGRDIKDSQSHINIQWVSESPRLGYCRCPIYPSNKEERANNPILVLPMLLFI